MLRDYEKPLTPLTFPVEGRDHEIGLIQENVCSIRLCQISSCVVQPGLVKTTLVRAMIKEDKNRLYFEVDLPKMTAVESSGEDVNSVIVLDVCRLCLTELKNSVDELGRFQRLGVLKRDD